MGIDRWTQYAVSRVVRAAQSRARLTVGLALGVALAAGLFAARNLGVHSDLKTLVTSPAIEAGRAFEDAFPLSSSQVLLVVLDGGSPQAVSRAADELGLRMAAEPEQFRAVFVPGGGPFFEENGLLFLELEELEVLADSLATAQPFLSELARTPNLAGALDVVGLLVEGVRRDLIPPEQAQALLAGLGDALDAAADGSKDASSVWMQLLFGAVADGGDDPGLVVVLPHFDYADVRPARGALERIDELIAELGLEQEGVRARVTGDFALNDEETQAVRRQAGLAGVASFLLVSVILALALRSAWLIASVLVTLVAGLVTSLGIAALVVGHLNPISTAFAVLFIGLSVDFGIHFCMRYRELVVPGAPAVDALDATARGVGGSLVLCALTTAIGFYAFVPTSFRGVAELGWIAGTGMFVSLALSVTLLPALIALRPARALPPVRPPRPVRGPRNPWPVRIAALTLAVGALALLPRARFDVNPLDTRDPAATSVQAFRDLLASSKASPWTLSVLAPDLPTAEQQARRLAALPEVDEAVSLADLVPARQAEKLEVLEEIGLFLGPAPAAGVGPASPAGARASLRSVAGELASVADEGGALAPHARRVAAAVSRLEGQLGGAGAESRVAELESTLVEPLLWSVRRLHAAAGAGPVTLADLPPDLVATAQAPDGRVRVEVFPSESLNDAAALERFVDAVVSVRPDAVGNARSLLASARAIVASFQQALLAAALAIALLLLVLWSPGRDTAVVLAVLGLAALLTAAGAVLAGIPFNYADIIVIPLLLGIGVDSSIHLVHRHRSDPERSHDLRRTSTGRAVLFSAATTLASFGSLSFATHRGMATLGQLLTLGVAVMLVCNLWVLPALLSPHPRRSRPRPG